MVKITKEAARIIRETCEAACRKEGQVLRRIEAGKRCALTLKVDPSINIRIVDKTKDWEDSDLFDFVSWAEFKKGVPDEGDGNALVDFYCYDREGLCTNAQAMWVSGILVWTGIDGRFGFTHYGSDELRDKT